MLALAAPTAISQPAEKAGIPRSRLFYKVRKSARGRREQRRRSRAAAASREGRRRNGRGRTRTLPALLRERRGSARGLGAVRGAGARERGPRPIKGSPQRFSRYVPRTSWLSLVLPGAAVSAASHLIRFIHARFCSALSRVGRSSAQDFPPRCFPPAPFLPRALVEPSFPLRARRLGPGRARVLVRTCQLRVTSLLSLPQRNVGLRAFEFSAKEKGG